MATMTGKLLADGQVSDSEGAIYTVPASTVTYIKSMEFSNVGGDTETLIVYIRNGSGTSRVIARAQLLDNYRLESDTPYALEAADSIRAETTNANSVDFAIFGVEEA